MDKGWIRDGYRIQIFHVTQLQALFVATYFRYSATPHVSRVTAHRNECRIPVFYAMQLQVLRNISHRDA